MSVNNVAFVNGATISTTTPSTRTSRPVECVPMIDETSSGKVLERIRDIADADTINESGQAGIVGISDDSRDLVQPQNSSNPITINDLPTEILIEIFRHVRGCYWFQTGAICCMTSLGLSSSRFYHVMKIIHPATISSCNGASDFLGPAYRFRVWDRRFDRSWYGNDIPFLRRAVYGDDYGEEEKALNDRFHDWKEFRTRFEVTLPHPFGMGKSWHEAVFDTMSRTAEFLYRRRCDRPNEWRSYDSMVTQHLGSFYTYKWMNFYFEEKYDSLREGALMISL
ncbi:hypothetical protein BKA64DRAFT_713807 [Cadophora sp. MPI-SDFR-AT-0126]|nr:hypothetical protein BKA64DRAFT_713807 [Leotiomycetes sp. MPI-SDFR-AT-0126]